MFLHQGYWDDVPPLGGAGRRWLRRRLYVITTRWIREQTKVNPGDRRAALLISVLVRELAAEPAYVLVWVDKTEWAGPGFASGHYFIREDAVLRRLPELFPQAAQLVDAGNFPQLDDWLDAWRRGILYSPVPREPSRTELFNRLGLRACRDCRASFPLDRRGVVRCPTCRAVRKARTNARGSV